MLCNIDAVQGVKVSSISIRVVNVSWDPLVNPNVSHYTVVYSPVTIESGSHNGEEHRVIFFSPSTHGVVGIADASYTYQFQVFATLTINGHLIDGERSSPVNYRPKMSDMETIPKCSPSKANYTPIIVGAVIAVIGVIVGITTACITITKSKRLLKGNLILY